MHGGLGMLLLIVQYSCHILAGGLIRWGPSSIEGPGVGGSEEAVIYISKEVCGCCPVTFSSAVSN